MAQGEPIRRFTSEIPDKLYFRIGEVARLCEVPAYVLRFWESEFTLLRPHKGGTGQRLFRRRDVETALRIKRLLYDEGYTIPGARQILKSEQKQKEPQLPLAIGTPLPPQTRQGLETLKSDLGSLLALLSGIPDSAPAPHPIRVGKPQRPRSQPISRLEYAPMPETNNLFDTPSPVRPGPDTDHNPQLDSTTDAETKET
jgi:DNA-binding transcriptional MerR regulator